MLPGHLDDGVCGNDLAAVLPSAEGTALFYRDRKFSERLALSIGMFTRGEVGAGVIFIALGYNLGGPALVISVLTIVLNLILTGIFVLWVKKLALRSYTT